MKRRPTLLFAAVSAWLCLAGCAHGGGRNASDNGAASSGLNIVKSSSFTAQLAQNNVDLALPEQVAESYIKALLAGDLKTAAGLHYTHGGSGMAQADALKALSGNGKALTMEYDRFDGDAREGRYMFEGTLTFANGKVLDFEMDEVSDTFIGNPPTTRAIDLQHPTVSGFNVAPDEATPTP